LLTRGAQDDGNYRGNDIMSSDSLRHAQAREHLNRLVELYASTEECAENNDTLRDIEWLVEQMALMSPAQFLDTVAPEDLSQPPEPSSGPKGLRAA
jgi:hypothetical protein